MRDWIRKLDPHPPDGVLLLYLSGELERKERHRVAEHLNGCWECMANVEDMRSCIRQFMKHHEGVVSSGIDAEPGIERVRRSLRKLNDEPEMAKAQSWILPSISWFRASAWIAAVSTSLLIGLVVFSTASPPKLTAAEFLKQAGRTMGTKGSVSEGAVYQKVRLTRGTKIIEREIVRGIGATPMHETTPPPWFGSVGPIDWADPLSVATFATWREAQVGKRDLIVEGPELITLTTIPELDGAEIREVSLTVRRSDWHVVGKVVAFRGEASLEAREAGYQSGTRADQVAIMRAVPTVNSAMPRGMPHTKPIEADTADLDETEIRVRSILFDRGFGFGEEAVSPSIRRAGSSVVVSAVILQEARRAELAAELAPVDHVRLDVAASIPVKAPAKRMIAISGFSSPAQSEGRPAQLRGMLIERLHSATEATRVSNQVLTQASNLLGLAARYRELADRYAEREAELLRPSSKSQLIALADRMEEAIRAELLREDEALRVVLTDRADMFSRQSVERWQIRARKLYELATRHDTLLSRLFAVSTGESHEAESVEENLNRLTALRREMKRLSNPRSDRNE